MKKITILLITFLFILSGCMFAKNDKVFTNVRSENQVTKDTFPFNQNGATINQVSFDILYGNGRDYIGYKGEVPYLNTRKDDGTIIKGFSNDPYLKNSPSLDVESYWGKTGITYANEDAISGFKAVSKSELEKVNETELKSLRLFGLSIYVPSVVGGMLYNVVSNFVKLIMFGLNLIVMLKSMDIMMILNALNIDNLAQTVIDLFVVQTSSNGGLRMSPFLLFALISFVISLTASAINVIKAKKTFRALLGEVVAVALFGLLLLGIGLSGNTLRLGNSFSNILNQFLYYSNPLSTNESIFITNVEGPNVDKNQLYYNQQISSINKVYIDAQIINQFNVDKVSDLAFSEFTTDQNIITSLVQHPDRVEHNLGYYYWWANSPAKTLDLTKMPEVSNSQQQKLSKMITFLQQSYNKAVEEQDVIKQNKIINIMASLGQHHAAAAFARMLFLSIIFILLAIVLFKYALKSAVGKILLIFSLLGLPIAAILIISTNKKLVQAGRSIVGLFVISFIQVVIYDLFFNLIVYTVMISLTNNWIVYIIVGIILGLFMKFSPFIHDYLNKLINSIKRNYTPSLVSVEQSLRTYASNQNRLFNERLRNSKGVEVGRDENDNPIYKKSMVNRFLQNVSDQIGNQLDSNAATRKSVGKVNRANKIRNQKEDDYVKTKLNTTDNKLRDAKIEEIEKDIQFAYTSKEKSIINKDVDGNTTFNVNNLTEQELKHYDEIESKKSKIEEIKQNRDYQHLSNKIKEKKLSVEEHNQLNSFNSQLRGLEKDLHKDNEKLKVDIQDRVRNEVYEEKKDDKVRLDALYTEKIQKQEKELKEKKELASEQEVKELYITKNKQKGLADNKLAKDNNNLTETEMRKIEKAIAEQRDEKISKGKKAKMKNEKLLDRLSDNTNTNTNTSTKNNENTDNKESDKKENKKPIFNLFNNKPNQTNKNSQDNSNKEKPSEEKVERKETPKNDKNPIDTELEQKIPLNKK